MALEQRVGGAEFGQNLVVGHVGNPPGLQGDPIGHGSARLQAV